MKLFSTSDICGNRKIMDKLNTIAPDVKLIIEIGRKLAFRTSVHKRLRMGGRRNIVY